MAKFTTEQITELMEFHGVKHEWDEYTQQFCMKYIAKKYWSGIVEVEHDRLDGYFIYLDDDHISLSTDCHLMHEYTLKDIRKEVQNMRLITQ